MQGTALPPSRLEVAAPHRMYLNDENPTDYEPSCL